MEGLFGRAKTSPAPDPMVVRRVPTENGSKPEPALDAAWSAFDKLRWQAALASLDCGIEVTVERSVCSGYGPGPHFDVVYEGGSCGPYEHLDAQRVITGFDIGVRAAQRRMATRRLKAVDPDAS